MSYLVKEKYLAATFCKSKTNHHVSLASSQNLRYVRFDRITYLPQPYPAQVTSAQFG